MEQQKHGDNSIWKKGLSNRLLAKCTTRLGRQIKDLENQESTMDEKVIIVILHTYSYSL